MSHLTGYRFSRSVFAPRDDRNQDLEQPPPAARSAVTRRSSCRRGARAPRSRARPLARPHPAAGQRAGLTAAVAAARHTRARAPRRRAGTAAEAAASLSACRARALETCPRGARAREQSARSTRSPRRRCRHVRQTRQVERASATDIPRGASASCACTWHACAPSFGGLIRVTVIYTRAPPVTG
mgnify:CR=1 FL=1